MSRKLEKMVEGFKREAIQMLLDNLTMEQRIRFRQLYGGVSNIAASKLDDAYALCDRTDLANRRRQS